MIFLKRSLAKGWSEKSVRKKMEFEVELRDPAGYILGIQTIVVSSFLAIAVDQCGITYTCIIVSTALDYPKTSNSI